MLSEFETDAVAAILALSQSSRTCSQQAQIQQTAQKNAVGLGESLENQQNQHQKQQQNQHQQHDHHDWRQFNLHQLQLRHQNQRNHRGPRAISCKACHHRKSKCSKDRPACASCAAKNIVCEYSVVFIHASTASPTSKTPTKRSHPQEQKQTKERKIDDNTNSFSLPSPASTVATTTTTMPGLSTPASDSSCKYYSDVLSNAANSHTPSATASSTPSASTAPSPIMTHISHPQQQFYPYSPLAPPYTLPIFQLPLPFLIRRRIELKHCVVRHESGVKPFYKCPSALCLARPKYKTPGGLKYHLTEEHSETAGGNNEFPFGWYWDDVSAAVARVAGEEDRYVCSIEGCKKRYTAMSGLRYHRKIAHLEAKE